MNAGSDYRKAKLLAQQNADLTNSPRWLHHYAGRWWISKDAGSGEARERIDPKKECKL